MELRFAIMTVVEIMAVVLLICGIWHEGKFIALEERIEDELARLIAATIIKKRKEKEENHGNTL